MNSSNIIPADELRRRAEGLFRQSAEQAGAPLSDIDSRRLTHELQVHQIELEMQNEELEKSRRELAVAAARHTELYDLAPIGYLTLDPEGVITQANIAGARLLGRDRGNLTGRRLAAFVGKNDLAAFDEFHRRVLSGDAGQACEVSLDTGRGDLFVRIGADHDPYTRESRVILEDITDRRVKDKALRLSESRLAGIIDSAMDAIISLDASQRIVLFNASAERIFGHTAAAVIGRPLDMLLPERYRESHHRLFDGFAATSVSHRGIDGQLELVGLHADGHEFPIEVSISQIVSGGERILTAIIRDVSGRQAALREQEQLQEQLRQAQKLESVALLAGGIAHDFNNMLSVILGYSELGLAEAKPESDLHEQLLQIQSAAERSAKLTRQLLTFARQQTIAPRVLELNETLKGMLALLKPVIREEIFLRWSPGASTGRVRIDPGQLDQLLANLCMNARDAINGTGEIEIQTDRVTLDGARFPGEPTPVHGDYARLVVRDTGSGMDPATLSHVFEPFFTTKEPGEGTGLGLATVYGIVRQNAGWIGVVSEPGKGTTFTIYLPSCESEASEPTAPPGALTARGKGEAILVVEDERAIMELCERLLTRQGYRVLPAGGPAEALRISSEFKGEIRLLLTDVIMPEMNGRELSELLIARHPGMKCVFMSGYPADIIARRGVLDEGTAFIHKPFRVEEMLARIDELITSSRRES